MEAETMSDSPQMLAIFQEHRSLLFGIAYRMLGSVSEAEDLLQELFLRWQRQSAEEVKSPKAWLTTAITRMCIDHLRSARKRREEYVGVWLPEPIISSDADREDRSRALADSLSTAFLVLIEALSPAERAVFLLREVFEYDYSEIGKILEKTEASCRQMVRRAREHLATRESRFEANPAQNERLVQQFLDVCRNGDTSGLLELLSEDVVLYSDGGGKVAAAPTPVSGSGRVARFLIGVSKVGRSGRTTQFAVLNSAPGVLIFRDGELSQTTSLEIVDGRIRAIYVVRNPEKLRHLSGSVPPS
jgi:RNA polymerase sigma-70 factor, ECF subfamily